MRSRVSTNLAAVAGLGRLAVASGREIAAAGRSAAPTSRRVAAGPVSAGLR